MSAPADRGTISRLLRDIHSLDEVDTDRRNQLFSAVYDELRAMARQLMRDEKAGHTLQPTALVHETFIRLVEQDGATWESRAHFFGIAARAMRQILVDHAREKAAGKRGGGLTRVSLSEAEGSEPPQAWEVLSLHGALDKLARQDARMARIAEMRIFGGLTGEETAHVLRVSPRTVDGDWSVARLWLSRELGAA